MRVQNKLKLRTGAGLSENYFRELEHSADDARAEKIDHLRKAIADRTYHRDAAELAFKIMEHMQEP